MSPGHPFNIRPRGQGYRVTNCSNISVEVAGVSLHSIEWLVSSLPQYWALSLLAFCISKNSKHYIEYRFSG